VIGALAYRVMTLRDWNFKLLCYDFVWLEL